MCLLHRLGGAFTQKPEDLPERLSKEASDLIQWTLDDVDPKRLIDYHTHVAGVGHGNTGAFVNSRMRTWAHPFHRIKFAVYLSACGIKNEVNTDSEYVDRLVNLVRHTPSHGKHRLLAFDQHYNADGSVNLEKTQFYVPNDYVLELAVRFPDLFIPAMSVHPYRPDAIAEMEKCATAGVRIVKWLPNAMGINPSDPRCDRFYEKMKQLGLILLSHGGEEKAVHASEDQKLGNPLLLRRPLEHGIKVIIAHCAGLGSNEDPESPGRERRPNFDFFLRLMEDKRYEGLAFGDISAMVQYNRIGKPLTTILERTDLHPRLVNGSDYPLPAINLLIPTGPLVRGGYLTERQRPLLKEIYQFNPILFDFVLKRCLTSPKNRQRLPASVFHENPDLA